LQDPSNFVSPPAKPGVYLREIKKASILDVVFRKKNHIQNEALCTTRISRSLYENN
jgi:hypothetical protein